MNNDVDNENDDSSIYLSLSQWNVLEAIAKVSFFVFIYACHHSSVIFEFTVHRANQYSSLELRGVENPLFYIFYRRFSLELEHL